MITLRNLITHSTVHILCKSDIDKSKDVYGTIVYGYITAHIGPGDSYSINNIIIKYDTVRKAMYMTLSDSQIISKALFDRDISPVCYAAIDKIKESFGKLEYDTIYLVTTDKATKSVKEPKDVKGN